MTVWKTKLDRDVSILSCPKSIKHTFQWQIEKGQMINNDLQDTKQNVKDQATRTPLKI